MITPIRILTVFLALAALIAAFWYFSSRSSEPDTPFGASTPTISSTASSSSSSASVSRPSAKPSAADREAFPAPAKKILELIDESDLADRQKRAQDKFAALDQKLDKLDAELKALGLPEQPVSTPHVEPDPEIEALNERITAMREHMAARAARSASGSAL